MARPKPLAELIEDCIGPAFAAQGFASADILGAWPEIVGSKLARFCQPVKLEWPRRPRRDPGRPHRDPDGRTEPGTLVVRVEGAFALELQHLVPVVIQRINAHYGWACIGRIVLKQGRLASGLRRSTTRTIDPQSRDAVAKAVAPIETDDLRDALDRLGLAVLGTESPSR